VQGDFWRPRGTCPPDPMTESTVPVSDKGIPSKLSWRDLQRRAGRLCAALGSTPDSVADSLAVEGVQGVPKSPGDCAMARYLSAVIGTERSVSSISVSYHSVHINRGRTSLPVVVRLPKGPSGFVREFDNGAYPHLIILCRDGGARQAEPRPRVG
jgi:hypothetical protein